MRRIAAAAGLYLLVGGVAAVHINRTARLDGFGGPGWFVVSALTWPWTTFLVVRRMLGLPPLYGRPEAGHGAASGHTATRPPS